MNCLGHKGWPQRVFFWCTNKNWKFSQLAEPNMKMGPIFDQISCYFSGQHERQIVDRMGFSPFGHMNIQNVDMRTMPASGLSELDRLAYVIHSIDNCCQIVPCGSFKKNTIGEVAPNDAFSGLEVSKLEDLNNYMHLRPVDQQDKKELAEREEDVFNGEFLDNLALDVPLSSWSVQKDPINALVVTIRSRVWPGYFAYHRANSGVFGGVYMGDGVKNIDLMFML